MREGNIGRFILDQITEGQLDWAPMASPFDMMILEGPNGRKEFPMYSGREEYIQGLKKKFPKEEAVIDKYMDLVQVACTMISIPSLFPTRLAFSLVKKLVGYGERAELERQEGRNGHVCPGSSVRL